MSELLSVHSYKTVFALFEKVSTVEECDARDDAICNTARFTISLRYVLWESSSSIRQN